MPPYNTNVNPYTGGLDFNTFNYGVGVDSLPSNLKMTYDKSIFGTNIPGSEKLVSNISPEGLAGSSITTNHGGLFGNMTGAEIGGLGLGIGQLGLGALSYLENKKTAGKQRALLDQQLASNKQEMQHRAAARKALDTAFSNRNV